MGVAVAKMSGDFLHEPSREKTNNLGFRPGHDGTNRSVQLQKFRISGEKRLYYLCSEKKALISFAVADLRPYFAYADCWFSDDVAHMLQNCGTTNL